MANLYSIDLTQGKRFERALNDAENKQINISNERDRGIRRLKKGEIPHSSFNTINVDTDLSTWIITSFVNTNISLTYDNILDHSITNTSYTIPTVTNNAWIINDNENIIRYDTISMWDNLYSITNSYHTNRYGLSNYNTDIHDKSIHTRISVDPFISDNNSWSSNDDIIYRMKRKLDYRDNSNERANIHNRLNSDKHNTWYRNDDSDILERFYEVDNEVENFSQYSRRENSGNEIENLKIKAPFIKRVYVTNRGSSFDRTDLKFDLTIAREHFEESLKAMV